MMGDAKDEKKKRSTAKGRFHRVFNRAVQGIDDSEDEEVLKLICGDLENAYKVVEEKHDVVIEAMDLDDTTIAEEF